MAIGISEEAKRELARLLAQKGEGLGLRLEIEEGGCAGSQYVMKVGSREEGDRVIGEEGAQVFIPEESATLLEGCTITYLDSLNDSGFRVDNPNASRHCGCGTSFEPAPAGEHAPS